MQQADIVASNIIYRMKNYNEEDLEKKASRPDELDKFRYVPLGEMLTLGNTDAAFTTNSFIVYKIRNMYMYHPVMRFSLCDVLV
jgi:NADH dehydrogenase FAD-containing subunit